MDVKYELERLTPLTVANTGGLGHGNVGAVSLRNFCIAIDSTIYVSTAEIFRKNLEKAFGVPVKYLIITHYHGDHIFGIKSFKDLPVISSELTSRVMESPEVKQRYQGYIEDFEKEDPLGKGIEFIFPDLLFKDTLIIQDEDLHIELYYAGGHTVGSSYVYFPAEKVLFAGDLIFENQFPYAGDDTCDPEQWITQLKKMKALNPDIIVPGHGPVMKGKESLDKHIDFFKSFREIIKDGIEKELKPEKIEIPQIFEEVNEETKLVTINHWLNYYKNK